MRPEPRSSAVADWHRITPPAPDDAEIEIVWLPGWGQTAGSLAPLARLLAARARNIVFDLPGFGQTPPLAEGAGSADYADALIGELKDGKRPRRRLLAGHSFGARVAIQAAARHPDRVDGLILIAAAGLKRRRGPLWRMKAAGLRSLGRLAGLSDRSLGTRLKPRFSARFGSEDYRKAGALRATLISVVNEDLTEIARSVRAPVLLIYGEQDDATPPAFGRRFAALFAEAELHILDGFGHLDILGPGAYQCQNLIDRFLARLA